MDNSYLQYELELNSEIHRGIGVLIFLAIIAIGAGVFCVKMKQPRLALVTVGLFAILLVSVWYFAVYPLQKDIEEKAYVKFEGKFYIEEYYQPYRSATYIRIIGGNDENAIRYKVLCDVGDIADNATYMGYFVFSRNSKSLVDFHVEKPVD